MSGAFVCTSHVSIGADVPFKLGVHVAFFSVSIVENDFSSTSGQNSVANLFVSLHIFTILCPSHSPGILSLLNISV